MRTRKRTIRKSIISLGLAAAMLLQSIVPAYAASDEIHLINDLGSNGQGRELTPEEEADRNWNEDLVSVAKGAWYDAHNGDDEDAEVRGTATASDLADSFEDFNEAKAQKEVEKYLKHADKEAASESGTWLSHMLKDAAFPEKAFPRDSSLKKEIMALYQLNNDEYTVFRSADRWIPQEGDILFFAETAAKKATANSLAATASELKEKPDEELRLKRKAANAVLGGVIIDAPQQEAGGDRYITFLYSKEKGRVEIGYVPLDKEEIIGFASVNALHDRYCGKMEEVEEEETSAAEQVTLSLPLMKAQTVAVTGLWLDKTELTLTAGRTQKLTATVEPENATNKEVMWSSSNTAVATVASDGTVKGVRVGTATINAVTKDGNIAVSCTVTVKAATVAVTGVKLNSTALNLVAGKTQKLTATVSPTNATNKKVTWKSSNTAIATVASDGTVKAVRPGTATVTVTTADGKKTASCKVTVKAATVAVTGVKLNRTSLTLVVGKTQKLTATVSPTNATNKKVTWKSSNTAIASVTSDGTVKALKAGKATITVTTADGKKTASCVLNVAPITGWANIDGKKYYYKNGTPVKGFQTIGGAYYYFDPKTGVMKTGEFTVNNIPCYFGADGKGLDGNWRHIGGKSYWYEKGQRQGTIYDKNGVMGDGTIRGREIYDPGTGAWYWLDAVYNGAKAENKEVWMPYIYQNENPKTNGKWVRYDENGGMIKGWYTVGDDFYYYDKTTGMMMKGAVKIDGYTYLFNTITGKLERTFTKHVGEGIWMICSRYLLQENSIKSVMLEMLDARIVDELKYVGKYKLSLKYKSAGYSDSGKAYYYLVFYDKDGFEIEDRIFSCVPGTIETYTVLMPKETYRIGLRYR